MKWDSFEFDESVEIQNEKGDIIADVWHSQYSSLIKHSPEMLEALELVYSEYKIEWVKDLIKKVKVK